MNAAEYRARINVARRKEHQAELKAQRFIKARNLWRRLIKRRIREAKEAAARRKANAEPHVVGKNGVQGGSPRDRLVYLGKLAVSEFRLYYEEDKPWYAPLWAILNVPRDIWRSDCSSWFLNAYRACGLGTLVEAASYGNTGGNTTSLAEHLKEVSREFAETHAGVAVIFYEGTECLPAQSIHVGMSDGTGPNGFQHGQEPVEHTLGLFDEFGVGYGVRFFDPIV